MSAGAGSPGPFPRAGVSAEGAAGGRRDRAGAGPLSRVLNLRPAAPRPSSPGRRPRVPVPRQDGKVTGFCVPSQR